jgi:hypothetical protein
MSRSRFTVKLRDRERVDDEGTNGLFTVVFVAGTVVRSPDGGQGHYPVMVWITIDGSPVISILPMRKTESVAEAAMDRCLTRNQRQLDRGERLTLREGIAEIDWEVRDAIVGHVMGGLPVLYSYSELSALHTHAAQRSS